MNTIGSLDDFTTDQLIKEIRRRNTATLKGLCPYCNNPVANHTCKYSGYLSAYHGQGTSQNIGYEIEEPVRHKGCECAACGTVIETEADGTSSPIGSMHIDCASEHERDHSEQW